MRIKIAILLVLIVSVSACSEAPGLEGPVTTEAPAPQFQIPGLAELTQTYGCGYGFWLGNGDQTVALRLEYAVPPDAPPTFIPEGSVTLPDPTWTAQMVFGTDLYANWCDDVIEDGEPAPVQTTTMPLTAGTITWLEAPAVFDGGRAAIAVDDLEVTTPEGDTVPLGGGQITNPDFGFFAG